jgi:hypothetical protein
LLEKLVHLDLSRNDITSEGVRTILASPRACRLQSLGVDGISLDGETRRLVAARFFAHSQMRS